MPVDWAIPGKSAAVAPTSTVGKGSSAMVVVGCQTMQVRDGDMVRVVSGPDEEEG